MSEPTKTHLWAKCDRCGYITLVTALGGKCLMPYAVKGSGPACDGRLTLVVTEREAKENHT